MASDKIIIEFDGNMTQLKAKLKGIDKDTAKVSKGFGSKIAAGAKAAAVPLALAAAAITAMGAAIGGLVSEASKIEDITTQFEVLTGSASSASKIVKDLQNFSATTPFQFEGIAKAAQQLLGFGFAADEIVPKMKQIGDVASAIGKPIDEVAFIFGQVAAAGKLTGERLLQFQERAIPIGPAIAKTMGIAESAVKDAVSAGKVDLETFQKAFASLSEEGGFAFEGMIKQSKTFSGLMSTVGDNVKILAAQIGAELLPVAKQLATAFLKALTALRELLTEDESVAIENAQKLREEFVKVGNSIESLIARQEAVKAAGGDFADFLVTRLENQLERQKEIQAIFDEEEAARQEEVDAAKVIAVKKVESEKTAAREKAAKVWDKKRAKIEKGELTAEQKFYAAKLKLDQQYTSATLSLAQNLSTLSQAISGKQNKVLFALTKAAAVANIFVSTQVAAAAALLTTPPVPNVALASIVQAAGAANIAAVAATTIQGFAKGGMVTGGIAGRDSVPAMLQQGELIVPRESFESVIGSVRAQREAEALTDEGAASSSVNVELSFKDNIGEFIEYQILERRTLGTGSI